jgi:hypothetical protein
VYLEMRPQAVEAGQLAGRSKEEGQRNCVLSPSYLSPFVKNNAHEN